MSKVICEICGTAYPDTARECPICGFPRNPLEAELDPEIEKELEQVHSDVSSQQVKGGRFSNKNVKKRLSDEPAEPSGWEPPERKPAPHSSGRKPILIVLLAAAVVIAAVLIAWRFVRGRDDAPAEPSSTVASTEQTDASTEAVSANPCTDLTVAAETVELKQAGATMLLEVTAAPADTTDAIRFQSSNEAVVTVSETGELTAVAPGGAVVTVTCGSISRECVVICAFSGGETQPPAASIPAEAGTLELSHSDVTLHKNGETFRIKATDAGQILSNVQLQWVSSDPEVASVDNGVVTAVRTGHATITAIYGEFAQECLVRVDIPGVEAKEPTRPDHYSDTNWRMTIESGDVTIRVGETFVLGVVNDAGEAAETAWTAADAGIVSISGNRIEGVGRGMTEVSATVDGKTFTCIIRVG